MFHRFLILLFSLIIYNESFGRSNDSSIFYLVYFKDKNQTSFSLNQGNKFLSQKAIDRRKKYHIELDSSDLPVDVQNIKFIQQIEGVKISGISKWLNAIEISVGVDHLSENESKINNQITKHLQSQASVLKVKYLGTLRVQRVNNDSIEIDEKYYQACGQLKSLKVDSLLCNFNENDYGKSFDQNKFIGIPELSRVSGKMSAYHIAVFDAGFHKAYRIKGMEDLLDSAQIIRDFVDRDGSVWEDDQHGCNVLGFMKTYNPGHYIGSSPFAKYTLIRTENADLESLTEEVNWLLAAEFVDSLGVDMISSSVGYTNFDDKFLSHSYLESNGKTAIISSAANRANSKGIMVVVSAGNEGNRNWRHIGFPADALGAISIGSCDEKGNYSSFSSVGPTIDGRIKPDFLVPGYKVNVAAAFGFYAGNGTSYATPIFAGALSQLMYLHPYVSIDSIRMALMASATHRHIPDSFVGYGLPDLALASMLLSNKQDLLQDLFWINAHAVLFQDLNIYFVSSIKQNIKIQIKTELKGRIRTLYKTSIKMEKGELFQSDILLQMFLNKLEMKKKMKQFKTLELFFESENSSIHKTFQIS